MARSSEFQYDGRLVIFRAAVIRAHYSPGHFQSGNDHSAAGGATRLTLRIAVSILACPRAQRVSYSMRVIQNLMLQAAPRGRHGGM
jgi:hypothetical protein